VTEAWNVSYWEKLNKYHIIFFTNTLFNAAVLCATTVLHFLLLPQMKQDRKEI